MLLSNIFIILLLTNLQGNLLEVIYGLSMKFKPKS